MAKPKETFAQYLQRRRFELGRDSGKKIKQAEMATMLEQKLANPIIKVSPTKLSAWECGVSTPRPELQDAIRQALGK